MNDNSRDLTTAEYVLGTLETDDWYQFELELQQDPALRESVETWERDLAPLLESSPSVTPSPDAWSRIERSIAAIEAATDSIRTVLRTDETWVGFLPGIEKKQLHVEKENKVQSYLLRFAPGASLPAHEHKVTEECLVLEGEISLSGQTLSAGDFQMLPAGCRTWKCSAPPGRWCMYVERSTDPPGTSIVSLET